MGKNDYGIGNREIKYKFFYKKKKIFVVPSKILFNGSVFTGIEYEEDSNSSVFSKVEKKILNSNQGTLVQYTGWKDQNGKEAYEGNIYNCGYEYRDGTHKYGDRNIIKDIRDFFPEDGFNIIGNIFENSELIK